MNPPFNAPEGSHWETLGNVHNLVRDDGLQLLCDFCATDPPKWRYRCDTFRAMDIFGKGTLTRVNSTDDWAACIECSKLIEANKWRALAMRSARMYVDKNPNSGMPFNLIYNHMRAFHSRFDEFRYGKREKLDV